MKSGNSLKRHGSVDGDEPGDGADAEGHPAREVLPRARGAEDELLERRVRREAHRGVGTCGLLVRALLRYEECNAPCRIICRGG